MKSADQESKKEKITTEKVLDNLWNHLDKIGYFLMGSLWRDVYETLQDAISLCLLFSIPGWISKLILKADYSGFDECYETWNAWNINRYACYVVVASGFVLWITIAGRIIGRTIKNVFNQNQKKTK